MRVEISLLQQRAFAGSRLRELPGGAQRRICKLDCRMTELADVIRIGIVNGDVARYAVEISGGASNLHVGPRRASLGFDAGIDLAARTPFAG